MSVFVQQEGTLCSFDTSDNWVILSPIEQSIKKKIELRGTPLKKWNIQINYGIKTGCNEAFIISSEKRDQILDNCKTLAERERTAELIRPILRGRDIKRYSYDWAGLWLIWIPWHFPLYLDPSIQGASAEAEEAFMNQYPSVYQHLLLYKPLLSARNKAETGIRYEWYTLQRWGANYWEDFSKPKIIFQEIVQESQFMMDQHGTFFCNDIGRIIVGENLYHILGVMNSKLFFYAIKQFYGGGALGDHGVRMKHTFFENFPCLSYSENIDSLSRKAVCSPDSNIIEELDNYIFDQYNLNEEEISLILNDSD